MSTQNICTFILDHTVPDVRTLLMFLLIVYNVNNERTGWLFCSFDELTYCCLYYGDLVVMEFLCELNDVTADPV
jgi:hypothetical protein